MTCSAVSECGRMGVPQTRPRWSSPVRSARRSVWSTHPRAPSIPALRVAALRLRPSVFQMYGAAREGDSSQPRLRERSVEGFAELGGVVGAARVRMAEDEVVFGLPGRRLEVAVEFAGQAVRHRDRADEVGLRRLDTVVASARVVVGHAHASGGPVDVAPAQREQFPLPQAGHCRRTGTGTLETAELVARHSA
jgi:hypothetical protein